MDLYKQLKSIETQCQHRRLSRSDTQSLMGLCIYAFLDEFPSRAEWTPPVRDKVLTAITANAIPSHTPAQNTLTDALQGMALAS